MGMCTGPAATISNRRQAREHRCMLDSPEVPARILIAAALSVGEAKSLAHVRRAGTRAAQMHGAASWCRCTEVARVIAKSSEDGAHLQIEIRRGELHRIAWHHTPVQKR